MTENRDKLNKILINYNRSYLSDVKINQIFDSEYNKQAIDFLLTTNTSIDIDFIASDTASWNNKTIVNKYNVTLKNENHTYKFIFFDSIKNTEEKKSAKYDFYSVLNCLSYFETTESFDHFCSEFGYSFKNETEYIRAKKTHLDCLEQDRNVKILFNKDQLELLNEIR